MITELKYSNTNTYIIGGNRGKILFDTGWAGTFSMFCKALGDVRISAQDIDYIFISHFHPDHMGIAQEIASLGPVIVVIDVQQPFIHSAENIFEKNKGLCFSPIDEEKVKIISAEESRSFLQKMGIDGEIIYTPGHSDDSVSLWLDEGVLFVGDLNPLYELEMHKGTQIEDSWKKLLALKPVKVYYGHARTAILNQTCDGKVSKGKMPNEENSEVYALVRRIMKYIDKGYTLNKIHQKTGADEEFIEDVTRMYLTHQNVGVQGILDRIEIKGK